MKQRPFASRSVNVALLVVAAMVPAIIAIGLIGRAAAVVTAVADRLPPFLSALPLSLGIAFGAGVAAAFLALVLSPGANGVGRTRPPRVAALVVAACVPPIVLVLGATLLMPFFGQRMLMIACQILAVYPLAALLIALAAENDLRRIGRLRFEHSLHRPNAVAFFAKVTTSRASAIALAGATLAFQNYLINLCLSDDPSRDVLVAMSALSPHTGVDWAAILSAGGILWLCSAAVAAVLLGTMSRTLNRGAS